MDSSLLDIEHLGGIAALIVLERFFPGHRLGIGLQNQADRLAGLPVVEGKRLLPPHMEQQITFANAAAQNHLDGIHTAGIVFADAYHLLILGEGQIQQIDCVQGCLVADGQTGANMTVKCGSFFP